MANWLGALAMAVQDAQEAATGHAGASRTAALLTVSAFPGTHIVDLSRILSLTHSAAVRIVDALVAEGLIMRTAYAGEDARHVALVPTAEGERKSRETQASRKRALAGMLAPLSRDQREQLAGILDTMLSGTSRRREEARHVCRFCEHSACKGPNCPVGRSVEEG